MHYMDDCLCIMYRLHMYWQKVTLYISVSVYVHVHVHYYLRFECLFKCLFNSLGKLKTASQPSTVHLREREGEFYP